MVIYQLHNLAGNWLAVRANKFVSSGKWYYEVKVGNNQYTTFGVGSVDYKINEMLMIGVCSKCIWILSI